MTQRYCIPCDRWFGSRVTVCPKCGEFTNPQDSGRKLTRTERQQGLADRGVDTWEEYRNER